MSAADEKIRTALRLRSEGKPQKVARKKRTDDLAELLAGPGSWNLHLVEAGADGDHDYIASVLLFELANACFLGREFGSFYTGHNAATIANAYSESDDPEFRALCAEWLKKWFATQWIASGCPRTSERWIYPGDVVAGQTPRIEKRKRIPVYPKGKTCDVTMPGNRSQPPPSYCLFGPLLRSAMGAPPTKDWPVQVMANAYKRDPSIGDMVQQAQDNAEEILRSIELFDKAEVCVMRYADGTIVSWISRTNNPNKTGIAAAITDPAGNYRAAMPTKFRRSKSPACGASIDHDRDVIVALGRDGVVEFALPQGQQVTLAVRYGDPVAALYSTDGVVQPA